MKKGNESDALRLKIVNRISRIEGQLKGVRRMLDEDVECLDVLTQILAARSAMSTLGIELLKEDMLCKSRDRKSIDEVYLNKLFSLT